jgi:hypothetical protein
MSACHVRSEARPCGIYGEQGSIETGFAPSTSFTLVSTVRPFINIYLLLSQATHTLKLRQLSASLNSTHISFHILVLAHTVCSLSVSYTSELFNLIIKTLNRIYVHSKRLVINKLRKLHTRRFITTFTSARHLSLSLASSTNSVTPNAHSLIYILILFSQLRHGHPCTRLSSPHTHYMLRPSHSSRFYHPQNIV